MTLSDRINATKCAITYCQRARVTDSLFCREHLNDLWFNRAPVAKEPVWITRMREGKLPAKEMAA